MAKKLKKAKPKSIPTKKKGKNNSKESKIKAIEILKKNLLEKENNNKSKEKKILTAKKKKKIKEKRKKIKLHKIPKKNKKQKKLKEEEQQNEESQEVNGGDMALKKNSSNKKLSSLQNETKNKNKKQDSQQTLLQMIKNRKNLEEVALNEGLHINIVKPKNTSKKKDKQKKDNKKNKKEENKKEENQASSNIERNEEKDKNEFMKQIKSKIVIKNGRMIMEKPDVGLISKKYDEEHNKHIIETIFVNEDEKLTSLSFLKKEKTKKWTEEETNNFYKALELFGLDFSFLSIVLSPRRREEIKRKYLKEKRKNPGEIERAIYSRKNVTKLSKVLNLYKNEKNQNNLSLTLTKSDSFSKRKVPELKEEINYNKEYKNILNKENS